jgi:hypothetical protein
MALELHLKSCFASANGKFCTSLQEDNKLLLFYSGSGVTTAGMTTAGMMMVGVTMADKTMAGVTMVAGWST